MSWLGCLNFLLLQWLCVRLGRVVELDGSVSGYRLLTGIVPLTGWWSPYRYLP